MNNFVKKASSKLSKLSDEQLEQLLETVMTQNNIFDSVMESLSSGIILLDMEWKIISMNKAAERNLPFILLQSEQKNEHFLWDLIDDKYISNFLYNACKNDKTNISDEFSFTLNESVHFVNIKILPLVQKIEDTEKDCVKKMISGSIITIEDITEKRQKEILSHRMESLRSLTNLAASVAHEIKNPLGAISIHIQLLQKAIKKSREGDGLLPKEKFLEDYISVVNEEIENLNKIVLDFLFAVRPIQPEFSLVDVDSVIEKTVKFFTPEFNSKDVEIQCQLMNNQTRLLIDENLFRQVLINIAQNSLFAIQERFGTAQSVDLDKAFCSESQLENDEDQIRFNEEENKLPESFNSDINHGTLFFESFIKNEKYYLTITDNGCGMDEKTAARIFEPYYTTKANGTGLGMTMVYKIIKEFNGDIEVHSVKGHGTSFSITLPVPQRTTMLLEDKKEEDR